MSCCKSVTDDIVTKRGTRFPTKVSKYSIRYRDNKTNGFFVDGEFLVPGENSKRKNGWLIENVNKERFFVAEDKFNLYFEIIEEVEE